MAGLLDPSQGDGTYVENRPSKWAQTWGILGPYVTEPFNAMERLWNSPAIQYGFEPSEQDVADSFNIAGSVVGAGSVVPKPQNAVGMAMTKGTFPGNKLPSIDALAKKRDKFVYHSGVSDDVSSLQYGVEPQIGPWVEEVLAGSVDDEDFMREIMTNAVPVAWWSKEPTWAAAKVARKLNKPVSEVTEADLLEHGHVAMVPKKDSEAQYLYWIGQEGLRNGPYSEIEDISGRKIKAYDTDLFQGEYGPEGVERNEYITARSIEPYLQLTGPELVEFLRKTGWLKSGIAGLLGGGAAMNAMTAEPQEQY